MLPQTEAANMMSTQNALLLAASPAGGVEESNKQQLVDLEVWDGGEI